MGNGASADGEQGASAPVEAKREGQNGGSDGGGLTGAFKGRMANFTGVAGDMVQSAQGFMNRQIADTQRKARTAAESGGMVHFVQERFLPPAPPPPSTRDMDGGEEDMSDVGRVEQQGIFAKLRWKLEKDKAEYERKKASRREDAQQRRQEAAKLRRQHNAERNELFDEEGMARIDLEEEEDTAWENAMDDLEVLDEAAGREHEAQRTQLEEKEAEKRDDIDEAAERGADSILAECRLKARQRQMRAKREAERARRKKEQAARQKAALERQEEERRRREEEEQQRLEEAQRIAAAEEEAEKERLEAEAEAARLAAAQKREQRREEAARRRAEEKARLIKEAKARAEAAAAAERERIAAEEAARKQREEEEAARIAAEAEAAEAEAERERLQAAAAEAARKRQEEEERRRREEERLAAEVVAADDAEESDDDGEEHVPEPTMQGTRSTLFKNEPNTYRIVARQGTKDERWGIFNGMSKHECVITCTFSGNHMRALGDTVSKKLPNGSTEFTLTVYPLQEKEYVAGKADGWRGSYKARGLSPEYMAKVAAERSAAVAVSLERVRAFGVDENERITKCVESSVRFVDPSFPPGDAAMTGGAADSRHAGSPWCDPGVFLPPGMKPRMVKNGIVCDDIDQGSLGDCWFLSSIACVAEFPSKIAMLMVPPSGQKVALKAERKMGAYRVWLCKSGWWRNWVVDEHLPGASGPMFASNEQEPDEMWVSVLEKAYAKAHNGYANIAGGFGDLALRDLTGYATKNWTQDITSGDEKTTNALFERLCVWDEQGYLLWIATGGSNTEGLVGNHAYSLIAAVECDGIKLIRCRNPWGRGEWTGAWSDKSDMWTKHPHVADACGYTPDTDPDDGVFWIEWSDALANFDSGCTCFMKMGWADFRVKLPMADRRATFAMFIHVKVPIDVHITMWQPCSRASDYESKPHVLSLAEYKKHVSKNGGKVPQYQTVLYNTNDPSHEKTSKVYEYSGALLIGTRLRPTKKGCPYIVQAQPWNDAYSDGSWENVFGIASDAPVGDAFEVEFREMPEDGMTTFTIDVDALPVVEAEYQVRPDDGRATMFGRGHSTRPEPADVGASYL